MLAVASVAAVAAKKMRLRADWMAKVPFPEAEGLSPDPQIQRLLSVRAARWSDDEGQQAHAQIVAMGDEAVPEIIVCFKRAANRDKLIHEPEFNWDTGWDVNAALYALRDIGDRRAFGPLGKLAKYERGKSNRASRAIFEILAQGSDEQLRADAKSDDPRIARYARLLLERAEELEGLRRNARERRARRLRDPGPVTVRPGAVSAGGGEAGRQDEGFGQKKTPDPASPG